MNEQELTSLLERAAASTPITEVPWDDITTDGQGQSTHRKPLVLLGVVTVTALVVLGVVFSQQALDGARLDETPVASPTSSQTNLPVAPSGMRLVGMGSIAVAVPEAWATEIGGCYDLPLQNRVFYPSDENPSCAGQRPPDTSSVQFYDSRSSSVTGLVNEAVMRDEVNGVSVLRAPTEPTGDTGVVEGVMVISSDHLLIWVDSPDAEVVDRTLDSVTRLPEGYVAIPSVDGTWQETRQAMMEAGLVVSVTRTDELVNGAKIGDITYTKPSLGSVVETGSSVTMFVVGMTKADWD